MVGLQSCGRWGQAPAVLLCSARVLPVVLPVRIGLAPTGHRFGVLLFRELLWGLALLLAIRLVGLVGGTERVGLAEAWSARQVSIG